MKNKAIRTCVLLRNTNEYFAKIIIKYWLIILIIILSLAATYLSLLLFTLNCKPITSNSDIVITSNNHATTKISKYIMCIQILFVVEFSPISTLSFIRTVVHSGLYIVISYRQTLFSCEPRAESAPKRVWYTHC